MAELLSDAVTASEIAQILAQLNIADPGPCSKHRRIYDALVQRQRRDGCGNNVAQFILKVVDPARFTGDHEAFSYYREKANAILAFSGLHITESGGLSQVPPAQSLTDAQQRAGRLRGELRQRKVHAEVLKFCRAELLDENYFHAVLEATKSVAERLRNLTELTCDGADLVDKAFGINSPILAINSLRSETEQSEQKGFANLLKGLFGTYRNVTAHAPKAVWPIGEQDALDLLSLVSYVHRRLDAAVRVPKCP
ncbi:MAG: TIGR02391 family protein [Dehalococcoidales bacterium]|nr:TIGR02391 family protein [Dehalococcoidales bacterium]